ncbi:MAG TPA: segregation/condensation protein A [Candidatus Anaerobutyricum stercoris]|uniref:Segregation and condensation protein A n=1 Tax=Candidatus Anaerobutyricum stercoris TaxID=2838457 RepID=A0A9D2ENH9_9FIRM|nr:Segregation and condensation protein A [Eubacteriaceae bacterium CHKCI004]HIZ40502.1 segregation/condensation protein A [Candidatus Anaerobutyricum stercoris]
MKIDVKLEAFEGPLDLLLHLIEKNKVNIYDIPIVEITNQYMEYIQEMERSTSMESMSEFLVMAATLLKIKSRMLLPKEEKEEEEDPREELVQRLVEYKMCRYAAGELKDMSVDAEKVFYKTETIPKEIREYEEPIRPSEIVGDVTLEKLNQVFQMVMRRKKDREDPVRSRFGKIEKEKYKVEDRMRDIRRQIQGLRRINFRTLLDIQPTKEMVIVTFLAVLELMKVGQVTVSQESNFGEIYMDAADA